MRSAAITGGRPDHHHLGRNPYDITTMCGGPVDEALCYPLTRYDLTILNTHSYSSEIGFVRHITDYLSRSKIQSKLGVDPKAQGNFTLTAMDVGTTFIRNLDHVRQTYHYVAALLERGVKILIYVGKNDWICNHIGNEKWTMELEWTGKKEFTSQELREWRVAGKVAGETRSAKGLTFATIRGAGHMVRNSTSIPFLSVLTPSHRSLTTNRRNLLKWSIGGCVDKISNAHDSSEMLNCWFSK